MADKIEDFGEKIGGARKDLFSEIKERGLRVDDISDWTDVEREKYITKKQIWAVPDYQKMVDDGMSVRAAWFIKRVYDSLPAKPKYKEYPYAGDLQEIYIKAITAVRDAAREIRSESDIEDFRENVMANYDYHDLNKLNSYGVFSRKFTNASTIYGYSELDREIRKKQFLYTEDEKALSKYAVLKFDGSNVRNSDSYDTCLEISYRNNRYFSYHYNNDDEFNNLDNWQADTYFVIGKMNKIHGINFENEEAAKKFIIEYEKENAPEKETSKNRKKKLKPPQLAGIERKGEDYRGERNITGEDMLSEFGFRGGEFGNWENQNDRQHNLNMSYDAFRDLARALGIKDSDISLGDKLAIAYGARGHGGIAAAHFEPDRNVINLTKMSGAGSLAHEWGHALDFFIAHSLSRKSFFETENTYRQSSPIHNVMKAIKYHSEDGKATSFSEFYRNAKALDNNFSKADKGYWASDVELFARAFACYVMDKLSPDRSDYLCGHAEMDAVASDGKVIATYPQGNEREDINKAFDELIEYLKEQEIFHERTEMKAVDNALEQPEETLSPVDTKLENNSIDTSKSAVTEAVSEAMQLIEKAEIAKKLEIGDIIYLAPTTMLDSRLNRTEIEGAYAKITEISEKEISMYTYSDKTLENMRGINTIWSNKDEHWSMNLAKQGFEMIKKAEPQAEKTQEATLSPLDTKSEQAAELPAEKGKERKLQFKGNEIWNKATDNDFKTIVTAGADDLDKIVQRMENAGMNYYAYSVDNIAKIAINNSDTDKFRRLIGAEADKLKYEKSPKQYTPPKKNIIGNTAYQDINDKAYFKGDTDILLKMAELMQSEGINFSGRVYSQKNTTLTVDKTDEPKVKEIHNVVQAHRTSTAHTNIDRNNKAEEIGNIPYADLKNADHYSPSMSAERFREIKPNLDSMVSYSGFIAESGKIVLTAERENMPDLIKAIIAAERQIDLAKELEDMPRMGLFSIFQGDDVRFYKSSEITANELMRTAVNSEKPFLSLMEKGERITPEEFAEIQQSDKFKFSVDFDFNENTARIYAVDNGKGGIFDENRTDENTLIKNFQLTQPEKNEPAQEQPESTLSPVDTKSEQTNDRPIVSDFRKKTEEYFNAIDGNSPADIEEMVRDFAQDIFAENEINAEIGEVIVTGSRSRGLENESSDIDVVIEVNSDLKEDSLFNILHGDELEIGGVTVDINPIRAEESGTLEEYLPKAEEYLEEKSQNAVTERAEERLNADIDDEPNIYVYDGSMSPEDFDRMQLLNTLAEITQTEDSTPYKLIEAYDNSAMSDWENDSQKQQAIKNALYEIIGDEEKTEQAYTAIEQSRFADTIDKITLSPVDTKSEQNIERPVVTEKEKVTENEQEKNRPEKHQTDNEGRDTFRPISEGIEATDKNVQVTENTFNDIHGEQLSMFGVTETAAEQSTEASYRIYQIKSGEEYHFNRFEEYAENQGKLCRDDYDFVYEGKWDDLDGTSAEDKLNSLWRIFNTDEKPHDFKGHSLSMSDVITVGNDDTETAYYVDRFGFKEMPEFFLDKEQILINEYLNEHFADFIKPKLAFDERVAYTNEFFNYEKAWHNVDKGITELAERFRNGEDIREDLAKQIIKSNGSVDFKNIDGIDGFVSFDIKSGDDGVAISAKDSEKSFTWKEVGDVHLNYLKAAFKEIQNEKMREYPETTAEVNALIARMESGDYSKDVHPDMKISIEKHSLDFDLSQNDKFVLHDKFESYQGGIDENGHEAKDNFSGEERSITLTVTDKGYIEAELYESEDIYNPYTYAYFDPTSETERNALADRLSNFIDISDELSIYSEKDGLRTDIQLKNNEDVSLETEKETINDVPELDKSDISAEITVSENDTVEKMPQEQTVSDGAVDWSQYDELFKKMFSVNPNFFNGMLSDETIEQQEQMIENSVGNISHEDRMNIFHTMMNEEDTHEPSVDEKPLVEEKSNNFTITDDTLGEGGVKSKFKANIEAIQTLRTVESENRPATPEECETMSKYVGWGGLSQAFDENNKSWESEFTQLKDLLTDKEYSSARASVLDAFYTAPAIIDGIYEALESFGFDGGHLLEPALGVGNFLGRMPEEMAKHSEIHGTEIDSISGRIAQKLYPKADIKVEGFEKNNYQQGSFDVAVGNVPFGNLGFTDKKHGTSQLHDYFFAEALDKVKVGGVIAFVTSTGTLDKKDESVRKLLAEKADLIGAVRLPSGAFKANAGTDVTSDIIFLQKRSEPPAELPNWVHIGESENGLPINEYFAQNPEMILGELTVDTNPFSSGTKVVAHENSDLKTELSEAVSKLHAEIGDNRAADVYKKREEGIIEPPEDLRNFSLFKQDDKIYMKTVGTAYRLKYDKQNTAHRRAEAFIDLRDTTRELLEAQEQDKPDYVISELQEKLNSLYDDFYKKFGLLHSKANKRQLSEDISFSLVSSLEKSFEDDKLLEKSDIFTKRTIKPAQAVDHVDSAMEALTLSVAERAKVDFDYMEYLTDMSADMIKEELKGEIFEIPNSGGQYQTANEYLSGDIRAKLNAAEAAAQKDSRFEANVKALEAAMPEPLKAADIEIKIGARWFDPKIYEQFMYETFGTPMQNKSSYEARFWQKPKTIAIEFSEAANSYNIKNKKADHSVAVTNTYGTGKINAYEIFEALLNLREPKVNKTIEDENGKPKRVIDPEATKAAQRKANKIQNAFKDWIFKDPERREQLVSQYNELFNCIKPREYDGTNLRFPNMNSAICLHDHQKNAIAHALFGGNTLFAHSVGAGKTYEMIASAMESKRLGLCTKTLMCVPNHLTEQIGTDFMKLYPSANVLVATKKDFEKNNRRELFSKIATGNFDAIIVGHSQLKKIPMDIERQESILQEQLDDIVNGIKELKAQGEGKSYSVKELERIKRSLEKDLENLKTQKQDDVITFEQMGIDKLIVDEAHEFKNLFTATKLGRVSGIATSKSQKATDLFMKCRYLDEKTGGKGVILATGTPLSNSVTELHTMMRYLEYDFLKDKSLQHFDNWITIFGERKTEYELAPTGNKFRQKTRISNYTGMPELMSMFKQVADVRTADTLNLNVPKCEMEIVQVEPTDFQQKLVLELSDRADDVQLGGIDPSVDNMLRITSDGRKLGLDPRLIDPSYDDDPNTKLNRCVENVFNIHRDTAADKLTQVIFCDLGVPKKSSSQDVRDTDEISVSEQNSLEEECDFCVYNDIRDKLIAKGVPADEIAYIHDAKTEQQKTELFEKVRNGDVRILLGSTSKMGTGTNIQDKLIALHDLDIPWRPADMEQRAGRIVRQGNQNDTVKIFRYVTKGTFDAYSYQTLENKQKFISQIMTSKTPVRKCEDVDQQALSYSEIKALCTGDERIKEKMTLDNEVKELRLAKAEHRNMVYEMEDRIRSAPAQEEKWLKSIANLEADKEHISKLPLDAETGKPKFKITLGNTTYTDRTEAAKAFETITFSAVKGNYDKDMTIGDFQGFPLSVRMNSSTKRITASLKGKMCHSCEMGLSYPNNLKKLEQIYNIDQTIDNLNSRLNQLRIDVAEAESLAKQPFPQEQELKEKSERLEVLTDELNEAAKEAKKNGKNRERTNFFDTAKLKKEVMRAKNTPAKPKGQSQAQDESLD